MLSPEGFHGHERHQAFRTFKPGQQERIRHRLCIGIRKLSLVPLREQEAAPLVRQQSKRTALSPQRRLHIITQYPGQGSQESGQALRRSGCQRLPVKEITQQRVERFQGSPVNRLGTADADVSGDSHSYFQVAGAVQAPFRAIGVDQIRQRLEPLPLLPIPTRKSLGARSRSRTFEFHVSG